MSDGPIYAHQTSALARASLARRTLAQRQGVRPDRAARDSYEDRKFRAVDRNKVIVRGRAVGGRVVWDVLKILGPRKVEPYAVGCLWREEAIELAADCLLGRVSVALSGARTAFGSQRGGLWVPEHAPRRAASDFVQLVPRGDGSFEVQVKPKETPK